MTPQKKNIEGINVLLVEDDPELFTALRKLLDANGYNVLLPAGQTIVDNYDTAIALCRQNMPVIALLDILIKGKKDGIDIADFVIKQHFTRVVFLSGMNHDSYLRRISDLHLSDFIVKTTGGFLPDQLLTTLKLLQPALAASAAYRESAVSLSVQPAHIKKSSEGYQTRKISWPMLKFAETLPSEKNYVHLTLHTGEMLRSNMSLTAFQQLCPPELVRISRHCIINTRYITGKKSNWVYFLDKKECTVGDTYRNREVHDSLNKQL
ncbi:MAG: response regulator [Chitinophagaceae bacterium]|nr:response regulator [Chitinophagaceae bacterium]